MGKYSDIDTITDKILKDLYELADRTLELMNEETDKALNRDLWPEFGKKYSDKISDIFKKSVQSFYDDYTPSVYKRTGGLFDLLSVRLDDRGVPLYNSPLDLVDESNMHGDRKGGSLFNKVFIEGYHGGAEYISADKSSIWGSHPSPGTPYYRRGGFVKYPDSKKRKWHKYGKWGRPAVKTKSAYEYFSEDLNAAESGEIFTMFKDISNEYNNAAMQEVYKKIPLIEKDIFG